MKGVEQIPWLYDLYMDCIERFGLARWRRWVVDGARGVTLEVGCGTGRNLPLYGGADLVVGLELDLGLLAAARRKSSRAALVVASAEALPLASATFDTVVSSLVFCSVESPRLGLSEIRRVLRPAGQLRMLEHVRSGVPAVAWLQDRAQPAWTLITGGCHPNRDTEETIRQAGFETESRRARGTMRRLAARPRSITSSSGRASSR